MRGGREKWIWIGLALLLAAWVAVEVLKPKPTDWSHNFRPDRTGPYGTRVLADAMPMLFPGGEVSFAGEGAEAFLTREETGRPAIYFCIGYRFRMSEEVWEAIRDEVVAGDILFMAANEFPDVLKEALRVGTGMAEDTRDFIQRPGMEERRYTFERWHRYFTPKEGYAGETLGYTGTSGQPNYIRVPMGKGWVYLHANPVAFTNYFLLDERDGDYYRRALAFLPPDADVGWAVPLLAERGWALADDGVEQEQWVGDVEEREENQSLLRVVWAYPATRWALVMVLVAGVLYLLFRSKREQRVMPVVTAPENRTLEFVSVVTSLYYRQREHGVMARKRVEYFLEEVRGRYRLDTTVLDDDFARRLAERAGVTEEEARETVWRARALQEAREVSAEQLRAWMKCMSYFKRK